MKIRPATEEDIPGIKEVLRQSRYGANKPQTSKRGGIVYNLSPKQIGRVISNKKDVLLVAEDGGEVKGYCLAYELGEWKKEKPKWEQGVKSYKRNKDDYLSNEDNLYLRQVAVKENATGTGYRLEKEMEKVAQDRGYKHIVGEILRASKHPGESRNKNSEDFHKRMGYERFAHAKYDDRVWGVYEKEIPKKKSLEQEVSSIVAVGGILGSLFFFSLNITGNAIANLNVQNSSFLGAGLLIVGLVGAFFYFRNRKEL